MSEIVAKALDMAEARLLTDEVRADATAMWEKLRLLYEGQAHVALGYSSWGDYCAAEFDVGSSQAYRLLDAGRVRHLLGQRAETHSPIGGTNENAHSPNGGTGVDEAPRPMPFPTNERVTRGLAATARTDPDRAVAIWEQALVEHGPDATAEQVAAIANGHPPGPTLTEDEKRFLSSVRRALLHDDPQAAKRALAIWRAGVYDELDRIARAGS